ncbi:hypothetical protein SDC9_87607 [bioreactor metagenome]|uniref:Uncharacterized protein n=1 Tax=bioreactor metagenome TaxID=1076179 RepID=A0A644ZKU4_9ZZZZ
MQVVRVVQCVVPAVIIVAIRRIIRVSEVLRDLGAYIQLVKEDFPRFFVEARTVGVVKADILVVIQRRVALDLAERPSAAVVQQRIGCAELVVLQRLLLFLVEEFLHVFIAKVFAVENALHVELAKLFTAKRFRFIGRVKQVHGHRFHFRIEFAQFGLQESVFVFVVRFRNIQSV